MTSLSKRLRFALFGLTGAFAALSFIPAVSAQTVAAAPKSEPVPWLYVGSDIPRDPDWKFGVLPNGLRYAVRKNGVPPGQVSIRIGIEAGSLMEEESELGYAHFIEHLSFRGSRYLSDGEAKRVWQRLGATFGSDTNASTTNTQTIYKLDLPNVSSAALSESMKILSGMMGGPTMTQAEVDAERRTVLAEAREQFGPDYEAGEATRRLFFHGQRFATRPPIGTVASLTAATPASLRAFHDRWYRPERAVIAISGDVDPTLLEGLIKQFFSDWKGKGPFVPDPDFGKPMPAPQPTKAIAAAGLPLSVSMMWARPWVQKNDTIAYNQGKLVDLVAIRLINRRLETAARAGASFLSAQIDSEDVARSADATFINIVPVGENWQAAVRDVRLELATATKIAPPIDEVRREANEFDAALQVGVETQRTEPSAKQADDIIQAVDIRETVATAEVARTVFTGLKDQITPEMVLKATQRLLDGVGPRAMITSPAPIANAETLLAQALTAPVQAAKALTASKPVTFADLPALGKPGTIKSQSTVQQLDLTLAEYANGVRFVHFANPAEEGKVYVTVRFGKGMQAMPANAPSPGWAAPSALFASGIGNLNQDQLDRMTSGRKINTRFEIADDAFVFRSETRQSDLADQLRIIAAKLAFPRWDAAPVLRAKAGFVSGYGSYELSPQAVLARDAGALLKGNDPRWSTPTLAQAAKLTPKSFRSFWEPRLASGPIEVLVFGDVTKDEAEKAVAASFGAMKPRKPAKAISPTSPGPVATALPIVRTHKGAVDQAAAMLAWPTAGGTSNVLESRRLEILSQIFGDRMFDQLREAEGASYSPSVDSNWPSGFDNGGSFSIVAQLKPQGIARFFALSESIAKDLVDKPVTDDELKRAIAPMRERITRSATGSTFWLRNLEGVSFDPTKVNAVRSILSDFTRITPADLQASAKRWLKPETALRLKVEPVAK
jgi:zinc protease